jgi:hypothetical protein
LSIDLEWKNYDFWKPNKRKSSLKAPHLPRKLVTLSGNPTQVTSFYILDHGISKLPTSNTAGSQIWRITYGLRCSLFLPPITVSSIRSPLRTTGVALRASLFTRRPTMPRSLCWQNDQNHSDLHVRSSGLSAKLRVFGMLKTSQRPLAMESFTVEWRRKIAGTYQIILNKIYPASQYDNIGTALTRPIALTIGIFA